MFGHKFARVILACHSGVHRDCGNLLGLARGGAERGGARSHVGGR